MIHDIMNDTWLPDAYLDENLYMLHATSCIAHIATSKATATASQGLVESGNKLKTMRSHMHFLMRALCTTSNLASRQID